MVSDSLVRRRRALFAGVANRLRRLSLGTWKYTGGAQARFTTAPGPRISLEAGDQPTFLDRPFGVLESRAFLHPHRQTPQDGAG